MTFGHERIERLIADRAYDSDPHRRAMRARDIELISPHRKHRTRSAKQDGRPLRRYRKRWKVERTIAWLQNWRRVVTRWDRSVKIYRAFVQLACAMIVLGRF